MMRMQSAVEAQQDLIDAANRKDGLIMDAQTYQALREAADDESLSYGELAAIEDAFAQRYRADPSERNARRVSTLVVSIDRERRRPYRINSDERTG